MNILFLSNIPTPYQLDFLDQLNKAKEHKVFGYFLYSKEKNRDWNLKLPEYVYIANYSKTLKDYIDLYQYIKKNKISIIVIGGYSLPMTIFTVFLTKIKKLKLYFWLERPINEQNGIKKTLKELYLHIVLSNAYKIFAIGKLAVDRYIIYNKKVIDLPYSMNLEKFYKIKKEDKVAKIKFLFSGQYIDRKNILNTINAFKKIKNDDIELNIIGGGELKNEVDELIKYDNRINDLGFIQPNDLIEVYAKNDIFIMPSKHDGWALVINEAMAAGMPIISTNKVGAVVEYIEHKENGYICNTEIDSIQEGIEFYISNKENILLHSNKNREIIRQSLGDVKNASIKLLEELDDKTLK